MGLGSGREIYDEDHQSFRESVRRFLATTIGAHLDDWRADGQVPGGLLTEAGGLGLLGTAVSEEWGGGGVDDLRFVSVLVEEVMGYGATGLALTVALHSGACLPLLSRHASPEQQRSWLPLLATGERTVTPVGVGHPGVGAPLEDSVLVTADFHGVAGGLGASDLLLSFECHGRTQVALVPADSPGVSRAAVSDSLAARDAGLADITFEQVTIPLTDVLRGEAHLDLVRDLDLWSAVLAVGGARSALAMTASYVQDRNVFGHPLSGFENTQHRLVEMSAQLMIAEHFVDSCLAQGASRPLAGTRVAAARMNASRVHHLIVDQGLQLHGGYGYMREYPISHAFADAQFLRLQADAFSDPRNAWAQEGCVNTGVVEA